MVGGGGEHSLFPSEVATSRQLTLSILNLPLLHKNSIIIHFGCGQFRNLRLSSIIIP